MRKRTLATEAIASEGRLLRRVALHRLNAAAARVLADVAREVSQPLPSARNVGATALGDPRKLRGLPAIGRGVGGTMAGTQPEAEVCR